MNLSCTGVRTMSKSEASEILKNEIEKLRLKPFSLFKNWCETRHVEVITVTGKSGQEYQIEAQVMPEGTAMRVLLAIDDGILPGAMAPLCDDFVVEPKN